MNKILGLLILAVGVLYLLNNTGVIDATFGQMVSTYWPLIIIAIGLKVLLEGLWETYRFARRDKWRFGGTFWGLAITAVGIVILGNRAGWFYYTLADLWSWTWPLLIIFAGFQLLKGRNTVVVFDRDKDGKEYSYRMSGSEDEDEDEYFDKETFKKNLKKDIKRTVEEATRPSREYEQEVNKKKTGHAEEGRKRAFQHGRSDVERVSQFVGEVSLGRRPWKLNNTDIKTTIGAVEVDLTTAVLKDGVNYLDIDVFIGAVEVTVPKDMAIKVTARANVGEANLFGDSGSGTYTSVNFDEAEQKVVMNVRTNIGAVEVMAVD
ncbi:hypothetical protein CR205_03675 [Alteribacter lacisalsi]|uniref:Cell wall-active antibiotics response LiaF-like C-terminal domain-containing protein n=1 Tax=Alteribacter lacisalsi TaxID=2045244 RepID=A0A2W0HJL8_9BACI|nr:cell wall-active antibiotics response protein [Alteribacter lacisalsi]PYZ97705.1 hypothetical protein CR205_03675 [Alteribacter lacisalsi]